MQLVVATKKCFYSVMTTKKCFYSTVFSRVTLQLRANNAEESSISSEARVWARGGVAVSQGGGSAFGQLGHARSDGVRP